MFADGINFYLFEYCDYCDNFSIGCSVREKKITVVKESQFLKQDD